MVDKSKLLSILGLKDTNQGSSTGYNFLNSSGKKSDVFSPVDGNKISSIIETDEETYEKIIEAASTAFVSWRKVPAPKRGEIVRQIGNELRENKDSLGVRIGVKSGGCAGMSYIMEYAKAQQPNDELIEDKGVKVFIDPSAIMYLLGTEMDYKVEEFSSSFVFNNPNETERCGCGESFKI